MHHFVHMYGNPEDRNELHTINFKDWEAIAFKHPGYLEDMWKQACDAYAWSSFDPEICGETDIMVYGEELHNDLQLMPEGERETYITAYRQKLSAQLSALSRCANPMVTGRGGFDYRRQEKDVAYPCAELDARDNVANSLSRRFYEDHGVSKMTQAVEVCRPEGDTTVMTTRYCCLLYTSPSPRDVEESRMPSAA